MHPLPQPLSPPPPPPLAFELWEGLVAAPAVSYGPWKAPKQHVYFAPIHAQKHSFIIVLWKKLSGKLTEQPKRGSSLMGWQRKAYGVISKRKAIGLHYGAEAP